MKLVTSVRAGGTAFFAAFISACWLALLLAEFGIFRAWPCFAIAALVATAVFVHEVRCYRADSADERNAPGGLALALIVLLALASFLASTPASELLLGGWDPGVYLHTAAAIEKHGGILIDEPDLKALTGAEMDALTRNNSGIVEPFGGMRLLPDGRITPQFHHLYPSLLALAWSVGGIRAALLVNPVLNACCIVALFIFLTGIVGRWPAAAAALVLALNPAQIWLAKSCLSELQTQLLFLGGFTFLTSALSGGRKNRLHAILAGAGFGMALLARFDSLMLLIPFVAYLLVSWRELGDRKNAVIALAVFLALVLQFILHHHYVSPYYLPGINNVAGAAKSLWLAFAALALWALLNRWPAFRLGEKLRARGRIIHVAIAIAFSAWCLFAWFVRPHLVEAGQVTRVVLKMLHVFGHEGWMRTLASMEAINMLYLANLFGPFALTLALIGIVVFIFQCRHVTHRAWLYSSMAVLVILVGRIYCEHFMMFLSRRFVPVILPLLAGGIAVTLAAIAGTRIGAASIAPPRWSFAFRRALVLPILALVLAANIASIHTMVTMREWPRLIEWYEELVPQMPAKAVVYCDQPGFAAPLRFMYGLRAWESLMRTAGQRSLLGDVMEEKLQHGDDVMFLSMSGTIPDRRFAFESTGTFPLESHIFFNMQRAVPSAIRPRGGIFVLYRVSLTGIAGPPSASAP